MITRKRWNLNECRAFVVNFWKLDKTILKNLEVKRGFNHFDSFKRSMELTDPKVANIRISRSFEISLLNTKGKVLLLVAASVRYRFFNAGCWKIVGEGNTQLRAYSWTCMVQARTSIKIQFTLAKEIGERGRKRKNKRRNKFEVGLRSNAFDLNERTPECYDQSAQKAGVDR